jgi:predicted nucleic acid-binding protein
MTPGEVEQQLANLRALFILLPDGPQIFPEWERLVTELKVIGKNGHDARLVAAMKIHAVPRLLTFNDQDFKRYPDIEVLTPSAVLDEAGKQ